MLIQCHGTPDGNEDSLKTLITARQQSREEKLGGFFDSLEEKYCKKPKVSGSIKVVVVQDHKRQPRWLPRLALLVMAEGR